MLIAIRLRVGEVLVVDVWQEDIKKGSAEAGAGVCVQIAVHPARVRVASPTRRGGALGLMPLEELREDQHVLLNQIDFVREAGGVLDRVQDVPAAGRHGDMRTGIKQKSPRKVKIANDLYLTEA